MKTATLYPWLLLRRRAGSKRKHPGTSWHQRHGAMATWSPDSYLQIPYSPFLRLLTCTSRLTMSV